MGADAVCIGLLDDANDLFPDQTREVLQKIEEVLPSGTVELRARNAF
jgi:hypothetical protein